MGCPGVPSTTADSCAGTCGYRALAKVFTVWSDPWVSVTAVPPLTSSCCETVKFGTVPTSATLGGTAPHVANTRSVLLPVWPWGSVTVSFRSYESVLLDTSGTKLALRVFAAIRLALLPAGRCVNSQWYDSGWFSLAVQAAVMASSGSPGFASSATGQTPPQPRRARGGGGRGRPAVGW